MNFKKMTYKANNNITDGRYYLLNFDNEIIFDSLHIEKIQEKKCRIEFISRARGTYFPGKFRIVDCKMNTIL
jgi:hypothetical protein